MSPLGDLANPAVFPDVQLVANTFLITPGYGKHENKREETLCYVSIVTAKKHPLDMMVSQ